MLSHNTYRLTWVSLTLYMGYLFTAAPPDLEHGVAPPMEKKCKKKHKMAVWGDLTNSCEKKRSEKQRRKGKIEASQCRVPKNSKER